MGDKFILGMTFLNTFYQVYDMERNQIALVPNIYHNDLNEPVVLVRTPFYLIMAATLTLLFSL